MRIKIPGYVERHPYITAWIILAVGMVIMLLLASQNAGLEPHQLAFLVLATIGLAGACVWILTWESGDEEEEEQI